MFSYMKKVIFKLAFEAHSSTLKVVIFRVTVPPSYNMSSPITN